MVCIALIFQALPGQAGSSAAGGFCSWPSGVGFVPSADGVSPS